jgi:hypothetical protein
MIAFEAEGLGRCTSTDVNFDLDFRAAKGDAIVLDKDVAARNKV